MGKCIYSYFICRYLFDFVMNEVLLSSVYRQLIFVSKFLGLIACLCMNIVVIGNFNDHIYILIEERG